MSTDTDARPDVSILTRAYPVAEQRAFGIEAAGAIGFDFEAGRIDELLAGLRHKPVLTVSDADDFTKQGGIIQLRLVDRKIRFEINVDAAERAGLNISSKLLSLATRFRRGD